MPRSSRSGTFAMVHAAVIDDKRVGASELRMLVALGTYADGEGWCWPKQKSLALRLGISRQAVSKALRDLADHGYIEIHEQHDEATGSRLSSRYRVILDFVLPAEQRRTPQPEIAGGQRQIAAPATSALHAPQPQELRPPQRDVAAIEELDQKNKPREQTQRKGAAPAERAPTPSGRVIDAVRAGGAEITMRPQDHKALKDSGADPEAVAEAYCAIFHGTWGDEFCRRNLSVQFVIGRLAGYRATKANGPARPKSVPGVTNPTLGSNGTRRQVNVRRV